MITEYTSETIEIVFGLLFFIATMSAVLLPYALTSFKLAKVEVATSTSPGKGPWRL